MKLPSRPETVFLYLMVGGELLLSLAIRQAPYELRFPYLAGVHLAYLVWCIFLFVMDRNNSRFAWLRKHVPLLAVVYVALCVVCVWFAGMLTPVALLPYLFAL